MKTIAILSSVIALTGCQIKDANLTVDEHGRYTGSAIVEVNGITVEPVFEGKL